MWLPTYPLKKLGLSQAVLARLLAVSVELVQHQGIRKPQPIACRLLEDMEGEPARWLARLGQPGRGAKGKAPRSAGTV